MKPLLRKKASFATLLALSLLTSANAHAVTYTPGTPSQVWWAYLPTGTTMADTRTMTISSGFMYLLKSGNPGTLYYTTTNTNSVTTRIQNGWGSFSLGTGNAAGSGLGSDSKGNIVIAQANNAGVYVLPYASGSAANLKKLSYNAGTISGLGAAPFLAVTGNAYTTDVISNSVPPTSGAFVHYLPDNTQELRRPELYKSTSTNTQAGAYSNDVFAVTLPAEAKANTGAYVKPCRQDPTQVIVHTGGINSKTIHYSIPIDNTPLANRTPANSRSVATKVKELPCDCLSAMLLGTGDKKFYIYASHTHEGWNNDGVKFVVQNANPGKEARMISFTVRTPIVNTQAAGMVGAWVDAEFSSDGNSIYVYVMQPSVGAWCYKVPVEEYQEQSYARDLSVSHMIQNSQSGVENRVDATFTWTPSTTHNMMLQLHTGEGNENKDWTNIRSFTKASNTNRMSYTYVNILKSGEYRIVAFDTNPQDPTDSNLHFYYEGANSRVDFECPFLPVVPKWDGNGESAAYAPGGYGMVVLNWNNPYGPTPNCYEISRDGLIIAPRHPISNYIDRDLPEGEYEYEIKAIYLDTDAESGMQSVHPFARPNFSAKKNVSGSATDTSEPIMVSVPMVDPGLNQYKIEPVYNVRISESFDQNPVCPNFTCPWVYRQGEYRNGYWYIAQWSNSSELKYGTSASVIRFDASKTNEADFIASAETLFTDNAEWNANIGIGIDDAGNVFINKLSRFGLIKERYNSYMLPMLTGRILRPKGNGTAELELANDLDFKSKIPFDDRTIYYQITGNMLSDEGAYLYLSEFQTNAMYRVHIVNGQVESYIKYNHTTGADHSAPAVPIETYAHPVRGTDIVLHSIRGGGLYSVNLSNPSAITSKTMIDSKSVSNSVGVANYWHNNRMFIITPNDEFPHSAGNFMLSVAGSSDDGYGVWSDDPSHCDYDAAHTVPVATYTQTDMSNLVVGNNAAGWFYCEPLEEDAESDGFYIYQYVPGIRFAKYRVTYDFALESQQPSFEMKMRYATDDNQKPVDIEGIDGVATWSTVKNIGQANECSDSYRTVLCYQLDVLNENDQVIETTYIDAAGNAADASILDNHSAVNWIAPSDAATLTHTITGLDESAFAANLTVHYLNQNTGNIDSSITSIETLNPSYEAAAVTNPSIRVVHKPVVTTEGESKMLYRLAFDFQQPNFSIREEPVSFYQIEAQRPGSDQWEPLDQLYVFTAADSQTKMPAKVKARVDAAEEEADEQPGADRIAGTYDFYNDRQNLALDDVDNDPAVAIQYVLSDYDQLGTPVDDPAEWNYRMVARYAVNSEVRDDLQPIAKNASIPVVPQNLGEVLTGIGAAYADSELSLYPVPARSEVTLASGEPVNTIEIYSFTGARVLAVDGGGANRVAVNIESLAPGNYLIRVNAVKVMRLIKI